MASKRTALKHSASRDCAILVGDRLEHVLAAGPGLGGASTNISARAHCNVNTDTVAYHGWCLDFPIGSADVEQDIRDVVQEIHDAGHGIRFEGAIEGGSMTVRQSTHYRIKVKLPRGMYTISIEEADKEVMARLPGAADKPHTIVTIRLNAGAKIGVSGFGWPFHNPYNPTMRGWVNRNEPIFPGVTLKSFLEGNTFSIVTRVTVSTAQAQWDESLLPAPFEYPYGNEHIFDLDRYGPLFEKNKRIATFMPAIEFPDDNSQVTVATHSVIQDVYWVYVAAESIKKRRCRAYFVPIGDPRTDPTEVKNFYVVVSLPPRLKDLLKQAWQRLTNKNGIFVAGLFAREQDTEPCGQWDAKLVDHSGQISELNDHPTETWEVILQVRRGDLLRDKHGNPRFVIKTFGTRSIANAALKAGTTQPRAAKDLHAAIWRGAGFWDWHQKWCNNLDTAMAGLSLGDSRAAASVAGVPVIDFVGDEDPKYLKALFEEDLVADRVAFRKYLSNVFAGIGAVDGSPGFGKTTKESVAGLAMRHHLGPVLVCAASNAASDNIGDRLDDVDCSSSDRYNSRLSPGEDRWRRRLIIRMYHQPQEVAAVFRLLKDPSAVAEPSREWRRTGPWKLRNSLAGWVLACLGSPAMEGVRQVHPDDSQALHRLQAHFQDPDFQSLREVATGQISWAEYERGGLLISSGEIKNIFTKFLIQKADFLVSTPAMTESDQLCQEFKTSRARAILVDEAGCMTRADLMSVWGNTLLPCFLAGDRCQLPPTVMSRMEADAKGNLYHCLAKDAAVSALEFLQSSGVSIFRPRVQLRMPDDMFGYVAELVYPDTRFVYGWQCRVEGAKYAPGRYLEAFLEGMDPKFRTSLPEKLLPAFIHRPTDVFANEDTGSKVCPGQVEYAFDFILDLVTSTEVQAGEILVLAPYKANVVLFNKIKESRNCPSLSSLRPASTVDSVQGKEGDIVVLIMGTNEQRGPGFTRDKKRLNVMLTRQRSGLVVIGDFKVVGSVSGPPRDRVTVQIIDDDGEARRVEVTMLWNFLHRLGRDRRVLGFDVAAEEAGRGTGKGGGAGRGGGKGGGKGTERGWGRGGEASRGRGRGRGQGARAW
ncbi:uncharacterized protein DNG_07360 [Cephalotrichum gorgonifer]|uniref:DNA2/NAM7 helicase-like C-terminal domain-containing protein n=1 Tax=Cephalotrichum gorgonifer TaxID=2041049 RepID=A0AAE8N4G3_9PEZI|nr:uncharacterized protein DNG_07360 [Cephalotrichum gorgonifer]